MGVQKRYIRKPYLDPPYLADVLNVNLDVGGLIFYLTFLCVMSIYFYVGGTDDVCFEDLYDTGRRQLIRF